MISGHNVDYSSNCSAGNDHDEDSDKESEPEPKVMDKPLPRTSKRNTPDTAPGEARGGAASSGDRGGRGGRGGGYGGNDESTLYLNSLSSHLLDACQSLSINTPV